MSELETTPKKAIWRYGLILLGLALCLFKFGSATLAAEDIRKNGERVLIDLRPADPRALFLGDYMALNYDREALPPRAPHRPAVLRNQPKDETAKNKGLAVIRLEDGIVRFDRLASMDEIGTDEKLAENERLIRYRKGRRGRYSYGGERYYFQSGTAKRYADARYGEFRLMPDGRVLLSGLAGEDKKTILIAGEAPKTE